MVMVPPRRVRWTGARFERVVLPVNTDPVWVDCWQCGGQGREFSQGPLGGWIYRTCIRCIGVGSVPEARR